jgi:hypothetical protein
MHDDPSPDQPEVTPDPTRCASVLAGSICPDDLCRNASEQTQCGAYVDDMLGESEWDTPAHLHGDDDL